MYVHLTMYALCQDLPQPSCREPQVAENQYITTEINSAHATSTPIGDSSTQ